MYPTIGHEYKYFHSTVQRAKDRPQKFHFCRLPLDVRQRNVKLNLSNASFPHRSSYRQAIHATFRFQKYSLAL